VVHQPYRLITTIGSHTIVSYYLLWCIQTERQFKVSGIAISGVGWAKWYGTEVPRWVQKPQWRSGSKSPESRFRYTLSSWKTHFPSSIEHWWNNTVERLTINLNLGLYPFPPRPPPKSLQISANFIVPRPTTHCRRGRVGMCPPVAIGQCSRSVAVTQAPILITRGNIGDGGPYWVPLVFLDAETGPKALPTLLFLGFLY